MKPQDPEASLLAALSQQIEYEYMDENREWEGSPFAWIRTRPSRQVGAIGEKLVAGWLAARGFDVARSGDSDADRIVENCRVEIKFSTLWQNGCYKFQQIRDQHYDFAICIGISPFEAHGWVIPKSDLIRLWKVEHKIASQHGGAGGDDTAWIDVPLRHPPEWIKPYGGSLTEALRRISQLTGRKVERLTDWLE